MAPKKEMTAFDMLAIERELQVLVGGYFDKAYQPTRDEVLLRMRAPGEGKLDVVVGLGRYLFVTGRARENPVEPPQFSQHLRRLLTGGKVLAIRQHGFDRVMIVEIGKSGEVYHLIVECFRDGNVVLVKDGVIVQPLIHRTWSHREVRPGRAWEFPPGRIDPGEATERQYVEALRASDRDLVRTLATVGNLGPVYAEEACLRAGVAKHTKVPQMDAAALAHVAHVTRELIREVAERPRPGLVLDADGSLLEATPVPLRLHDGLTRRSTATLSAALDELFTARSSREGVRDERLERLAAERGKLERQVEDMQRRVEEFKAEEVETRLAGDLLYAHFTDVDHLIREAQALHKGGGWGLLMKTPLARGRTRIAGHHPDRGAITLDLPDANGVVHHVDADLVKSLTENAEVQYARAKQLREKQEGARGALVEAERQLAELRDKGESVLRDAARGRTEAKPTKQFWFEKFRWFVASTGNLVVAGRDAKSNDQVVKKHLDDNDRYAHANIHGAPSVVVKAKDGEVPAQAIEEAGQFAVAFSRAWPSGLGRGEAYWVTPPQVTRTAQSGEFVPRGAFVIRGERTYMRADVRAAVGEVELEGQRKIMGGPVPALEARSTRFVVLEPGRADAGKLASALATLFAVPVEEVQRVMPPGGCRIVRKVGMPDDALGGLEG